MDQQRSRLQLTLRELLEIVAWFAAGFLALAYCIKDVSIGDPLVYSVGPLFGAGVGVIFRRRAQVAWVGFFVWLVGLIVVAVVQLII